MIKSQVKSEVVRTLIAHWSDSSADYVYTYTELQEYESGERQVITQEYGDKAWAKRIAKHYNLTVPSTKAL